MEFSLPQNIRLTTKATFSRNFGKRWDNRIPEDTEKAPLFDPSIDQWSIFAGVKMPVSWSGQQLILAGDLGLDNGFLIGDQVGLLVGLRWFL
jgi:hypothetical protein